MKTVGYVLSTFPVLSETFIGTEIRAMEAHGHTIVPIAFERVTGAIQEKDQRFLTETHYLTHVKAQDALITLFSSGLRSLHHEDMKWREALQFTLKQTSLRPRSLLWQAAKVAYVAKQRGCQHLHAHFAVNTAATAIVAAKLLGITVSFVGHGFDVYAEPCDLALKIQSADFVVAVCQQMQRDFNQLVNQGTAILMPCGIDLEAFPLSVGSMFNRRLLFVGRLVEKKGLHYLICALTLLPKSQIPQVDIVGEGPLQNTLQASIDKYGLSSKVTFLGAKDSCWLAENAHRYGGLIAPFCEAANGDKDTGPLVVKEAMALGLPVISTDFMGVKETLDQKSGWKVMTGSSACLADGILQWMAMDESERRRKILFARSRVSRFFSVRKTTKTLSLAINHESLSRAMVNQVVLDQESV